MSIEKKISQTKCSARNCGRTGGSDEDPNLTLHAFPSNESICREWLDRAGNPSLFDMPINRLNRRAFLCEHHFTPCQYMSFEERRLLPGALPTVFPTVSSSSSPSPSRSLLPTPVSSAPTTPLVISTVPSESLATPLPLPLPSGIPSPEVKFRIHDSQTDVSLGPSNPSLPGTSSAAPATFPLKTSVAGGSKRSLKRKAARASKFTPPPKLTLVSPTYHLKAGINPSIFNHLSSCASQMEDCNKYCAMLFDKMSISPSVVYNSTHDRLEGFEDHGSKGRSDAIAGEALVFMVRGVNQKWKQPVAFYFSGRSTPGLMLADIIKEVLGALQDTGLKIVATVCDVGSNNAMALKHLGCTIRNPFFVLNGQTIFTLYDSSQLVRWTRDAFLKHPLEGQVLVGDETVKGMGRWSHMRQIKERFLSPGSLSPSHLNPQGREKMSVGLAVEVFRSSMGLLLDLLGSNGHMRRDVFVTSDFLAFVNKLYTSFSGDDGRYSSYDDKLKLSSPLTDHSSHLKFWNEAIATINDWRFLKVVTDLEGNQILDSFCNPKIKGTVRPKCQNGWIITIRAIKLVWKELKKAGLISLEPRRLNQDPLGIFFESIRSHGGANHNPSMEQFASAFETFIINGNDDKYCLSDNDVFLANLKKFPRLNLSFRENTNEGEIASTDDLVGERSFLREDVGQLWTAESCMKDVSDTSVSCRILKALLQDSNCSTCLSLLTADPSLMCEQLLSTGEPLRIEGRLYFPSERFVKSVGCALVCLNDIIPNICLKERIGEVGKNAIPESVFSWITCTIHNVKEIAAKEVCKYALYRYSVNVSKRLCKKLG